MRVTETPNHLLIANNLYTNTAMFKGVCINKEFETPTIGYLVVVKAGLLFKNISAVNTHLISEWIKETILYKDQYFIGGVDERTGQVYFAIAQRTLDYLIAEEQLKPAIKTIIWDLSNHKNFNLR